MLSWNDGGINHIASLSDEFHVTAALACFHKAGGFRSALDFPKGQRIKPRQPQPR